jgi:hypothetical protein
MRQTQREWVALVCHLRVLVYDLEQCFVDLVVRIRHHQVTIPDKRVDNRQEKMSEIMRQQINEVERNAELLELL